MYRKYMATAAAVLVSVSLMMTGCNGNHAVKDNNIQQSEAVNAKSEDSTRTAAGSRTGTKQGTQKEGNTTGSAAQKRENQKTGNGSGNTNENTNVNNINITNGNGNGNGGRKGSKGGTGSGKTSTSTTKNVYNIYETHNHNTTNKTENHYSTTNNSRTENKYSSTTVNQEQNISETNNTDITNENYNYGDQSIGKTENTENNNNQNDGSQWFGGSGNDQGNESYAYESGESSTEDPSDDDYDNTTWAGFDDPDPVPVPDDGLTGSDGSTEEYTYPTEDVDNEGDEDWIEDPEYIEDEPVDDYPGYTDSEPAEEDPGYTDDEPAEEDPGYTDDDWADDGGSDDQGDESETFGQYVNPQLADEETGDTWELLDNGSEESVDVPSDSGSMQVSSDGTGSEAIDVSGNSTISFTVSMEDGSDGSGWIEVCDQEGNVIGQTGQVDAGGSTNASFDVSGTDTIQFRACTDSGETVNLQINSLEMN